MAKLKCLYPSFVSKYGNNEAEDLQWKLLCLCVTEKNIISKQIQTHLDRSYMFCIYLLTFFFTLIFFAAAACLSVLRKLVNLCCEFQFVLFLADWC